MEEPIMREELVVTQGTDNVCLVYSKKRYHNAVMVSIGQLV